MSTSTLPLCQSLSFRPSLPCTARVKYIPYTSSLNPTAFLSSFSSSRPWRNNWRFSCFKDENLDYGIPETGGDALPRDTVEQEPNQSNVKHDWPLKLRKAVDAIFSAEPWTVPWTAKTILQVMLLWIASFWLVGSWIIPFLAHIAGFRKETLTYRGQAFYSLLTDVAEGIAGIAILHRCLAPFRPLSPDWFKFSFKGKWLIDVGLGCLMFPLVNCLSQVNLNLLPMLPLAPVTVSNVEQSIVARDPVAMALYATVVSVCAPIWEEIVFRGFLLPSLTRKGLGSFTMLVQNPYMQSINFWWSAKEMDVWPFSTNHKKILKAGFYVATYSIWKERNKRCFDNKLREPKELVDEIKATFFLWIKNKGKNINWSWESWCKFEL